MIHPRPLILPLLFALLAPTALIAQVPAEPASVADRMLQAYRDLNAYSATTTYSVILTHGRKTRREWKTLEVAYTETGPRLKIDRPEALLVVDGDRLRFRIAQMPERFVAATAKSPLTFDTVQDYVSVFSPMPVDVALLLSDDPIAALRNGGSGPVESIPADASADGRPRVRFEAGSGTMTLQLDPQSYLVTRAELEVDAAQGGLLPGSSIRHVSEIEIHPGEAAASAFTFDEAGGEAYDDLQTMISRQGAPVSELVGQAAPPLAFHTIDGQAQSLAEVKSDVVVLDFWATWCGPCHMWAPELVKIHEWAKANNHSVTIIGVTVDDPQDIEAAKQLWRDKQYPMLLAIPDDKAEVDAWSPIERDAMGNPQRNMGLPYTVIVHNGKIAATHTGVGPNTRAEVQQEIEELLKQGDAAGTNATSTP